jgi:predicted amidohydrolase
MKVALAVNRVTADTDANLKMITNMANEAADNNADLVVFAEAALTGLINDDDPSHDLPLGQPIPWPVTDVLLELARERRVWLAIGMLEREGFALTTEGIHMNSRGGTIIADQIESFLSKAHGT